MSRQTISERLWEEFCDANSVRCDRVPVGVSRTPDYVIRLCDQRIACEVKQLEQDTCEREALEQSLLTGKTSTHWVRSGVRNKLKKVSGQLKSAAVAGVPTLLVMYDNGPLRSHLLHTHIIEAMFGQVGYPIITRSGNPEAVETGNPAFCGNRGLTPQQNTAISALAVLEPDDAGRLRLRTYHNIHAAVRLEPSLLDELPGEQMVLPDDTSVIWP